MKVIEHQMSMRTEVDTNLVYPDTNQSEIYFHMEQVQEMFYYNFMKLDAFKMPTAFNKKPFISSVNGSN